MAEINSRTREDRLAPFLGIHSFSRLIRLIFLQEHGVTLGLCYDLSPCVRGQGFPPENEKKKEWVSLTTF